MLEVVAAVCRLEEVFEIFVVEASNPRYHSLWFRCDDPSSHRSVKKVAERMIWVDREGNLIC